MATQFEVCTSKMLICKPDDLSIETLSNILLLSNKPLDGVRPTHSARKSIRAVDACSDGSGEKWHLDLTSYASIMHPL